MPIKCLQESKFISKLSDNLCAEVALGTVTSVREAVVWLLINKPMHIVSTSRQAYAYCVYRSPNSSLN